LLFFGALFFAAAAAFFACTFAIHPLRLTARGLKRMAQYSGGLWLWIESADLGAEHVP
jgi:hypothetical protein